MCGWISICYHCLIPIVAGLQRFCSRLNVVGPFHFSKAQWHGMVTFKYCYTETFKIQRSWLFSLLDLRYRINFLYKLSIIICVKQETRVSGSYSLNNISSMPLLKFTLAWIFLILQPGAKWPKAFNIGWIPYWAWQRSKLVCIIFQYLFQMNSFLDTRFDYF